MSGNFLGHHPDLAKQIVEVEHGSPDPLQCRVQLGRGQIGGSVEAGEVPPDVDGVINEADKLFGG